PMVRRPASSIVCEKAAAAKISRRNDAVAKYFIKRSPSVRCTFFTTASENYIRIINDHSEHDRDDDRQAFFLEIDITEQPRRQTECEDRGENRERRAKAGERNVRSFTKYRQSKTRRRINQQTRYGRDRDGRKKGCKDSHYKDYGGRYDDRNMRCFCFFVSASENGRKFIVFRH